MVDETSKNDFVAEVITPPPGRRRWGFNALVASSLAIGLSLWLHYSVDGRADSFAAIARRSLTAAHLAEQSYFKKQNRYTAEPTELSEELKNLRTGPYLLFLNPNCGRKIEPAQGSKTSIFDYVINKNSLARVPHDHEAGLTAVFAEKMKCPTKEIGFVIFAAAVSLKTGDWDVWQITEKAQISRIHESPLPPTRAHRIKQIALVLLVLGAVGLSSILLPRLFYRFFIRSQE